MKQKDVDSPEKNIRTLGFP